jgi:hypothetical protein
MFSAGSYLDLLARGLFGVDEHLDAIAIAPHVDGIADDHIWRLQGWRLGADSLSLAYRPADRAATLTLTPRRSVHLELRFGWLVRGSCAAVIRPNVTQYYDLVPRNDGWAAFDVAGGSETVTVRVSAAGCPKPS